MQGVAADGERAGRGGQLEAYAGAFSGFGGRGHRCGRDGGGDARTEEGEGQTEQCGGGAAGQSIHTAEARQRAPAGASVHGLNGVRLQGYGRLRPGADAFRAAPGRAITPV
ncbi:hypothetical protein GCM10010273_48460 [Streptomyces lavendulocolor]